MGASSWPTRSGGEEDVPQQAVTVDRVRLLYGPLSKIKWNQQPNFHQRQFLLKPYLDWSSSSSSSSLKSEPLVGAAPVSPLQVILKVEEAQAHHGIQASTHLSTKKKHIKDNAISAIKWSLKDSADNTPHQILLCNFFLGTDLNFVPGVPLLPELKESVW